MRMTRVLAVAIQKVQAQTLACCLRKLIKDAYSTVRYLTPLSFFRTTLVRTTCSSRISVKESGHEAALPKHRAIKCQR
ncbi:hypothetical protein HDV64DRAFT_217260 [Trichoderma sp. TUCIM 5745]